MNLPNKLSLFRIIAVPVMTLIYYLPVYMAPLWSVIIFIVAAFTDFLDGYIARKYNMVTDLGKLLDPIADKMLVVFALFIVVANGSLPVGWGGAACAVIVAREMLISIVRQIAASKGVIIQANIFGKLKTFSQDIALPLLMLFPLNIEGVLGDVIRYAGWGMFCVAVVMTVLSMIIYLWQNRGVFSEKKSEK